MARGWMDHPALAGGREPYCRRAAWAWLIESARYQDGDVDIAGKTVPLKRGQLSHSTRFLAAAWGWSEAGVRRFLERLKTDALIDAATDAGQTVITLCNYEKYQARSEEGDAACDAPADAGATQDRRSSDANKKEGNKGKEGKDIESVAPLDADRQAGVQQTSRPDAKRPRSKPAECRVTDQEFQSFWEAYPHRARQEYEPAVKKVFAAAVKRGASVGEIVLAARLYAAETADREDKFVKLPANWLRDGGWKRSAAQQSPAASEDLFDRPVGPAPQARPRDRPRGVNYLDIARDLMAGQDGLSPDEAPFAENFP